MKQVKETRPETAATVQSAHNEHLNDTPAEASRQVPATEEFLKISIWNLGCALEMQISEIGHIRNALALISDFLESDECDKYALHYDSVAVMAIYLADQVLGDMAKIKDGIFAHDRHRRALCGGAT